MKTLLKTLAVGLMALALAGCGAKSPFVFNKAFKEPVDSPAFIAACKARADWVEKHAFADKVITAGKLGITAVGTVFALPVGVAQAIAGVEFADRAAVKLWEKTTDNKCKEAGL